MAIPEGYTELGRIGFVDKGNYAAGTTYRSGDVVYYNGSTWTALKDNLKGVAPTNGANWKYMARGFAAENLASVTAKDTSGVIGTAGASVTSQALVDAIADKVMTKLLAKANVVNNLLTTEAGFALDARQGKALKDGLDSVNSDFINMTEATISKSSIATTIGRQRLQKIGRLVLMEITFLNVNDVPTDNYPFILPEGFRPKYELYATASSGDNVVSFEIAADGKIYARQAMPANTWYTISRLFFTS